MRFDSAKSFPHPVLRPGSSDYRGVEFEVTIDLKRTEGTTALDLDAKFELSDQDLCDLVKAGNAEYAILVECPQTHYRADVRSNRATASKSFGSGELAGEVDLRPFLVATCSIPSFSGRNWHHDYGGRSFDLDAGAVLATDTPQSFWLQALENVTIASIFCLKTSKSVEAGTWEVGLENKRIQLLFSEKDKDKLDAARGAAKATGDGMHWAPIMNGLYLPALIWVLEQADNQKSDLEKWDWYAALSTLLEHRGAPPLGAQDARDRVKDAHILMKAPFGDLLSLLNRRSEE